MGDGNTRTNVSLSRGLRAMTLEELQAIAADPEEGFFQRNLARVEWHKKFAIPAACLVFGLFGLPLGFNNRRGGRGSGFALSTLVILLYYVLLSNGEEAAAQGRLDPWLAMWGPNLLFSILGAFLLARKNRDKSLMLTRVDRWVRSHLWGRLNAHKRLREQKKLARQRRREAEGRNAERDVDVVLRIPRLRWRFPNLFDRYIIKTFVRVFVIVVLAVMAVYIVANFTELVDDVMENQISSSVIFDYYKYFSLQIFYQTAPIIVLLTVLTTFALLSYSNEITAAKALGMSLYRLAIPALAVALGIAGLSVALETYVLPITNTRSAELMDQIKGREPTRTYRRADRQWLYDDGVHLQLPVLRRPARRAATPPGFPLRRPASPHRPPLRQPGPPQ